MQLPESVIEPFGFIGMPTLILPKAVGYHIKQVITELFLSDVLMFSSIDFIAGEVQKTAILNGAEWCQIKYKELGLPGAYSIAIYFGVRGHETVWPMSFDILPQPKTAYNNPYSWP